MAWRVEILDETVAAEIAALPADMQARFLRLAERVASAGLQSLGEPHVKHLEGKLWELRLTGRSGIARALYARPSAEESWLFGHSSKRAGGRRELNLNLRCDGQRKSNDHSVRGDQGSSAGKPRG
jgi:phage-related protein